MADERIPDVLFLTLVAAMVVVAVLVVLASVIYRRDGRC